MFVLAVIAPLLAVLATYIFYPAMRLIRMKRLAAVPHPSNYSPKVSVLFAAYNEEVVLEQKIKSILSTDYPGELEILVGNDQSTDKTLDILTSFGSQVTSYTPDQRSGKSALMNELANRASGDVLIATDANILFQPATLSELVHPLSTPSIGATAGQLVYNKPNTNTSTAQNEKAYLNVENSIKLSESQCFGFCLGMEGGLYAIRKELWTPIPEHTYMEDFFQTISVLRQGKEIVFNQRAIGIEDISTSLEEEFKRKIRISIGNFQNLKRFAGFALKSPYPFGYAFLMHKILRWLTPVFMLWILVGLLFSPVSMATLILIAVSVPFQLLLVKINRPGPLTYFCAMNLAMFIGMLRYFKGVQSSVWQPTNRNQE